jgi:hypothetical protein
VNLARWVAALISPLVGYLVAISGAVFLASGLKHLCPKEQLVSGMCTAKWYASAELAVISVAASAGAALVVLLPAVLSPSHKRVVGIAAFAAGFLFVSHFTWQVGSSFLVPCASSTLVGGFTLWCLLRSPKHR